jgi:phage terminase large subunit-like protein
VENDYDILQKALWSGNEDVTELASSLIESLSQPIHTFKARPDQQLFVHDNFQGIMCLLAGNGAGKDYCTGYKTAKFLLTTPPPENKTAFWVASKTMPMTGQNCWIQSLSKFIPANRIQKINYYNVAAGWPNQVLLEPHDNGNQWIIHFKSYDQGRQGLQGANLAGFYLSEQCPLPLIREIIARTRKWKYPGSQIYNCTPLEPDLELEEIYNNQISYPSWKFYNMSAKAAAKAGHITEDYLKQILETELEELIETRLEGVFASYQGIIYRHFTKDCIIEPFTIPQGFIHTRGLDLGYSDPTACVWVAKSPDGTYYIYREYSQNRTLIRDHVKVIDDGWQYKHPAYGAIYADTDAQDLAEYAHHGMKNILRAWKESRNAGISILQHLFRDGKIKIFKTCPELIAALKGYVWNPKKSDEPLHVNSHLPDALRYCLSSEYAPVMKQPTSPIEPLKTNFNAYKQKHEYNPYKKS